MARMIERHVCHDGFNDTVLDALSLVASHCHREREPIVYEPGLIFVVQGEKTGFIDDRVIRYGAGHYLVQAIPLPFECETDGSADAPLLGAALRIAPELLAELAGAVNPGEAAPRDATAEDALPMAAVPLDGAIGEALERLLDCLEDPAAARALGQARIREVIFEALRGPQGHLLRQLLQSQGAYARIGGAIDLLRAEYASPLSVSALAGRAHMSVSSFHAHFKQLTRISPLQYQKRIRLLKARDLLLQNAANVSGAASAVGYQSASQFSREYKRYFGVAPTHDHGLGVDTADESLAS
ncbi:AraC family transcriptional regulator [Salinisphaera sp.]|uniref:AraC family transcriptional regulator n=1 Tax=Salinisphaera sp. TaxID=1914330 RepID=UPI003C7DF1F4